jgi:hypothetical protein
MPHASYFAKDVNIGPLRTRMARDSKLPAEQIRIDAPAWSSTPHLLLARGLELELGHGDLFRAARGAPVGAGHVGGSPGLIDEILAFVHSRTVLIALHQSLT